MAAGDKKEPNSGLWGKVELEDMPGAPQAQDPQKEPRLVTRKGTLMGFAAPVIGDVEPVQAPGADPNDPATRSTTPPARSADPRQGLQKSLSGAPPEQSFGPGRTLIGGSFTGGATKPAFPAVNPTSKGTLLGVPAPVLEPNLGRSSVTSPTPKGIPANRGNHTLPSNGEEAANPQAGHLGRFRIIRKIGTGRAGAVFLAQRVDAGGAQRFLAIKVLREQVYQDASALKALFREARLAALMDQRNVVRVVDIGYHKRQPYLVMDYVDGLSLATLLAHPVAVPLAIGLRCITDALHGLDYAHKLTDANGTRLGLVHCDVSPENILVGVDGFARVTDFGVARTREEHGEEFTFRGKPEFAAPELLGGEQQITPQTDVYSVGAVLFRLATGVALFQGKTEEERLQNAMTQPVPSALRVNPSLPAWLDEICARALGRDPARRYASCAEMAQALEREAEREELHADRAAVGQWVSRVRRSLSGQEVFDIKELGAIAESAKKKTKPAALAATQLNASAPVLAQEEESSSLQLRVGLGAALVLLVLVGGIWAIVAPDSFKAFLTQRPVTYLSKSAPNPVSEPPTALSVPASEPQRAHAAAIGVTPAVPVKSEPVGESPKQGLVEAPGAVTSVGTPGAGTLGARLEVASPGKSDPTLPKQTSKALSISPVAAPQVSSAVRPVVGGSAPIVVSPEPHSGSAGGASPTPVVRPVASGVILVGPASSLFSRDEH